jgi:hypothetical protein
LASCLLPQFGRDEELLMRISYATYHIDIHQKISHHIDIHRITKCVTQNDMTCCEVNVEYSIMQTHEMYILLVAIRAPKLGFDGKLLK